MRPQRHNETSRQDDEPAYDLAEYALLLSLIALAVIAVLTITGNPLPALFDSMGGAR